MWQSITALLFAVSISVMPWIIGGNYPFVRTFAGLLVTLLLLITLVHNLANKTAQAALSVEAKSVFGLFLLLLTCCGVQTFVPGQIFSTTLPAASRERFAELLIAFGFFAFAYFHFRNPRNILPFVSIIFLNGVLLAVFGVVQKLGWNGNLFWHYELVQGGIPFASFVNRNNAAGYLVICFAAAIFFLARSTFENRLSRVALVDSRATNLSDQVRISFENLEAQHLYYFSGLLLLAIAVVFSESRGGTLAMAASFITGCLILQRANRLLILSMALFVGAGIAFVAFSDQAKDVAERIQTLGDLEQAGTPRLEHWTVVIPYLSDHLLTGSGLGTYQFLYPRYQETQFIDWFRHAENQYLETMAETGIPGLLVLLATMFLICRSCVSPKQTACDQAVSVVGLMALVGQAIAACFDFGLYIPANSVLMATVMGLVLSRHCSSQSTENSDAPSARSSNGNAFSGLALVFVTVLTVGNVWGTYELSAVDSRHLASHQIRRFDPEKHTADLQFTACNLQRSCLTIPLESVPTTQKVTIKLACFTC